jgi:hypothetical protein
MRQHKFMRRPHRFGEHLWITLLFSLILLFSGCDSFQLLLPSSSRPTFFQCHMNNDRIQRHWPARIFGRSERWQRHASASDDIDLQELLQKVASDDPEWYREFVVKTLGQQDISDYAARQDDKLEEAREETQLDGSEDDESDEADDTVSKEEAVNMFLESNSDDELNPQQAIEPRARDSIDTMVDRMLDVELTMALNNSTSLQSNDSETAVVTENTTMNSSIDSKDLPHAYEDKSDFDTVALEDGRGVSVLLGVQLEDEKVVDDDACEATSMERESAPRNQSPGTHDEDKAALYPAAAASNQTLMVVFQPPFRRRPVRVPLKMLLELGYSANEVRMLDVDALDLIIVDKLARPKIGIPAGWKSKTPVIEIYELSDEDELIGVDTSKAPQTSLQQNGTARESVLVEPDDRVSSNPRQNGADEEGSDVRIALFSDPTGQVWESTLVSNLASLGYSERDIVSLDPGALNLILIKRILKPSSGVPSRWRRLEESEPILILPASKARAFMEEKEQSRRRAATSAGSSRQVEKPRPGKQAEMDEDDLPIRSHPLVSESSARAPSRDARTARSRRQSEDTRKTIYDGRPPRKTNKIPDPPAPSSKFWPDVDSFRDMLRNEARIRLLILGDDFVDSVKQESDWRLNLYKNWLWTLHSGVGEPMVESRSERMRRQQRKTGSQASTASQPERERRTLEERRPRPPSERSRRE